MNNIINYCRHCATHDSIKNGICGVCGKGKRTHPNFCLDCATENSIVNGVCTACNHKEDPSNWKLEKCTICDNKEHAISMVSGICSKCHSDSDGTPYGF